MHHNYGWCAWPKENSDKQLFFSVSQWSNTIIFYFSCCAKNLSIVCESESRQQREVVTVQTSYHPEDDKLCLSFQDSVPLHIIKGKMIRRPSVTMQKTGLTNYSSFLVWSGLEKNITYKCGHYGSVNNHFRHGDDNRTKEQPGDPSYLLWTTEQIRKCWSGYFCPLHLCYKYPKQ